MAEALPLKEDACARVDYFADLSDFREYSSDHALIRVWLFARRGRTRRFPNLQRLIFRMA